MATFNAGAIEAELTLDRSRFNRELGYAKQMATKFSKTKITPTLEVRGEEELARIAGLLEALDDKTIHVDIDVDEGPLDRLIRKIKDVEDRVTKVNKRKIKVETEVKDQNVNDLKRKLDDLDADDVEIVVDVDDRASTDLVRIERSLARIDDDVIEAEIVYDFDEMALERYEARLHRLDEDIIDVEFEVDTRGALAEIASVSHALDTMSGDIDLDVDITGEDAAFAGLAAKIKAFEAMNSIDLDVDAGKATSGLMSAGSGFGLIQGIVLAVIALLPLVPPLFASIGAAAGAIGTSLIGAGGAVGVLGLGIFGTVQRFNHLNEVIGNAEENLAKLKPGTKEYQQQLEALNAAQDQMNEQFGGMEDALLGVRLAWNDFIDAIQPQSIDLIVNSLGVLASMIPSLTPLFNVFADVANSALTKIAGFVNSDEWTRVINFFQTSGASSFDLLLRILGNLILFIGRMGEAFAPFTQIFLVGLENMTAKWADWADGIGKSKGFQDFIDYVVREGPKVWDLIVNLIGALINMGRALAPLGSIVLDGLNGFFKMIKDMDPTILGAIMVGLMGITSAIIAVNAVMAIAGVLAAMNPFVLLAIAIGALVAGIVYFVSTNEDAKEKVVAAWNWIKETIGPIVQDLWNSLQPLIEAVKGLAAQVMEYLIPAAQGIAAAFMWALPYLKQFGEFIGGVLIDSIKGVIRGATDLVTGITNVLGGLWEFVAGVFTGNWSRAWDGIKQIFSGFLQGIWGTIQVVWYGVIYKAFQVVWAAIKLIFTTSVNAIRSTATAGWNAIQSLFVGGMNHARNTVNAGLTFIRTVWNGAWSIIRSTTSTVWNTIRSVVSGAINFVRNTISTGINTVRNVFTTGFNAARSTVTNVFNAIRSIISSVMNNVRSTVSSIINAVHSTISNGVNNARNAATNAFNGMLNAIRNAMTNIQNAINNVINNIRNLFSGAGSWLTNAGRSIIQGLANGIRNAVGTATSAISDVVSNVRDYLPFSPAKTGPFSGRGYTTFSGRALVKDLALGMMDNIAEVENNAAKIAEAAMPIMPETGLPGYGTAGYSSQVPEYAPPAPQFYGQTGETTRTINVEYKVYNPLPEASSETAIKETTRLGQLGIFDG